MSWYDKNFEIATYPYFPEINDRIIDLSDKQNIVILSIPEYNNIDDVKFKENIDKYDIKIMILYQWAGFAELIKSIDNPRIKVILLQDSLKIYNSYKENYFFYPHWLLVIKNLSPTYKLTTEFPFSSANRNFNNGRQGKIVNYQLLKDKQYFNKILFSKFKSIEQFERYAVPELTSDETMQLLLDNFLLDYETWHQLNYNELELMRSVGELNIDVYTKSLFHIVAESVMEYPHLSEKTYKIFSSCQIPIMCGPYQSIKYLRDIGFDVFDDIVDHNHYDNILDWKDRIRAMHEVLDTLVDLDHIDLLIKTESRRLQNCKHLQSDTLTEMFISPIVSALSKLI